jgi:hypothetical protein
VRERHTMDPAEDRNEFEESHGWQSRLKGRWLELYERNALVRHLVHEPLFLAAVLSVVLAPGGVALMLPKRWDPAPEGFSKTVRVSLLDYVQAWSLRRSARRAEAESRWGGRPRRVARGPRQQSHRHGSASRHAFAAPAGAVDPLRESGAGVRRQRVAARARSHQPHPMPGSSPTSTNVIACPSSPSNSCVPGNPRCNRTRMSSGPVAC